MRHWIGHNRETIERMIGTIVNVLAIAYTMYLIIKYAISKQMGSVAIPALFLKVLAGILVGVVFKHLYTGGDTFSYYEEGIRISDYVRQHPGAAFSIFFDTDKVQNLWLILHYQEQPRALFFSKIIAFINVLTHANYWLMSVYFSLFSFFGSLLLVGQLIRRFEGIKTSAVMAFFYLPSVLFWSSGILKESVAIPALYFMVAFMLTELKPRDSVWWLLGLGFLVSGYLLWNLRYFYLGASLPFLLATVIAIKIQQNGRRQRIKRISPRMMYFLVVAAAFFFMSRMHFNLRHEHLIDVLYQNYQLFAQRSEPGNSIVFENLQPQLLSFLMYAPKALFSGLFRPNVWDIQNWRQLPQIAENFLILMISFISLYGVIKKKPHLGFWGLSAIIYVVMMSILFAYASPNFGSLMRYRSGYLSFFVLMILYQSPVSYLIEKLFSQKADL